MNPSPLIDLTINLISALWFGFVGACIGSFLNVVAYRMPLGISVVWKPSHCPKCKHPIRSYDNVPVLGWLWLRGKCRDCSQPISPRYAIVEFIMGLAFFVLAYAEVLSGGANLPGGPITEFTGAIDTVLTPHWPLLGIFAYHGLLLSLLMSIALIDIDGQKVPRSLLGFGAIVAGMLTYAGVRSLMGLDPLSTDPPQDASSLVSMISGACGGIIAGAAISTFWRGRFTLTDNPLATGTTPETDKLFDRPGKPYSKTENLLAAFALTGFFMGYQFIAVAFGCTIIMTLLARAILFHKQRKSAAIILPLLWLIVTVLIVIWNDVASSLPPE